MNRSLDFQCSNGVRVSIVIISEELILQGPAGTQQQCFLARMLELKFGVTTAVVGG